jgi:predicted amidohydrolase YtcJ
MRKVNIFRIGAAILFMTGCTSKKKVDLLVYHANIYTVDDSFSKASAMAISGNIITAVGSDEDILNRFESDQRVDAGGRAVYPGLIDAHAHFVEYGNSLFEVDLTGSSNWEEALRRVQQFAAAHPGEYWILGHGWDQNKFPGKTFPDNTVLNRLFPDNPVLLKRIDGHAALANAKALELSGVHVNQSPLTGGTVEKKKGALTGILIDNAVALVDSHIPAPTLEEYSKRLIAAQKNCFAQGLTTITDCGLPYTTAMLIDSLQKAGLLRMQLYIMLSDEPANYQTFLKRGPYKTDRLFIKGFKVYADGALGSRGACLLQDYRDRPGWKGFLLHPAAHYDSVAALLAGTEFQMCTHAIGDSGNHVILKVYNQYLKGKNDKRWRIEHAQTIQPDDFKLFGSASIIPSVQPTHATSDMYWAGERLGSVRLKSAYAYRQLLEQNGWLPLGTDFPVEDISPFKTFYSAVFRKDSAGFPAGGFQIENALTREEALRGMTIWAAKADFLEKEVGSIEAGKKADFIILDRDLMKTDEKEILQTKVISTYVNGVKVY